MEKIENCILCGSKKIESKCSNKDLYGCKDCKFIFHNPRPTIEEIVKYYSSEGHYNKWIKELDSRERIWDRRLRKILKYRKNGRLLDISAGIGEFLYKAKEHFEIFGTEISKTAVDEAKNRYCIEIENCDFNNYKIIGNLFNIITIFHVLEHVHDPGNFINKCYKILDKDGLLVIAVPNDINSFINKAKSIIKGNITEKYKGISKIDLNRPNDEIHLSHFTPATLKHLLESNNFRVIEQDLDQHLGPKGIKLIKRFLMYGIFKAIYEITGFNGYETMLFIAKKNNCKQDYNYLYC
jgi:ubiquinone/menaquinone biosynthesis C-methylase UbiE